MIELVKRRPLMSAVLALLLLGVLATAFPIVPETKQAVVVRFGKPERILNQWRPNQPIGSAGAGISWRIPFVENIVWIDKRVLDVDMERQPVLSTDQRRLEVDAFARYRIVNPLRMYITARSESNLAAALRPILGSEVRNELGKVPFAALLSPERQGIMENVRKRLDIVAQQYGAQVIDVRIKKADLPDGTPLRSAYEQMRSAREQEARSIRAEGGKQAQIIRAQADADAAKTYAASFGRDPQFYDFYRAMQSYEATFVGDENNKPAETNIILSPQNDYLREFTGRSR
ncbi:protease modulator HflC [Sphingomonas sinipercae]|uniref:Protein HflC n=1 Tax=Sphingomonas sinipercae TaxID=2714944 RepID=A0A6G7ZQ64_9SPHN|nr:protease modulator HflC [Sphingomonas sinipercae]QIL03124.1 protease modulator HflC [Sphingomonas sinipercae]